jgi:hypothetical protein
MVTSEIDMAEDYDMKERQCEDKEKNVKFVVE